MTTQQKIDAIAAYGFGVYSFANGFAIADPNGDEEGWYLSTLPINSIVRPTLEEILDQTIEELKRSVVEGPLA